MDNWTGKSIIVVDDNSEVLAAQVDVYRDLGFNIVAAVESGIKALEIAQESPPDFFSLDIIMPEMDGIECFYKIREARFNSEILFVSALCVDDRIVQAYSSDMPEACFMTKPLTPEAVKTALLAISEFRNESPITRPDQDFVQPPEMPELPKI